MTNHTEPEIRLLAPQQTDATDAAIEVTLRPSRLYEFVGQEPIKEL